MSDSPRLLGRLHSLSLSCSDVVFDSHGKSWNGALQANYLMSLGSRESDWFTEKSKFGYDGN